ncbi:hypothetical protein ACE38V_14375 [Cytobacillus sp. Hz8]|uniref:hypothetical protein n=1 Tax=Cytobacillus sp. Hz8 TaxID=3347168 RepID=UPI0035D7CA87
MLKNERGSTLLTVMLMIFVFSILGLSILSVSLGGSNRTSIRENEVEDSLTSINALNIGVATIKKFVNDYSKQMGNPDDFSKQLDSFIHSSNDEAKNEFVITNLTESIEYKDKINPSKDYTRVLLVKSNIDGSKSFTQKVYITGMPSFLKYALGSKGELTLNGSVYLQKGNLFANEGLKISNQARYIYHNEKKEVLTTFPSVSKNSLLYAEEGTQLEYCQSTCYQGDNELPFQALNVNDISRVFNPNAPTFSIDDTTFVDVDIEKTFKDKLKDAGFLEENTDPYNLSVEEIIKNGSHNSSISNVTSFDELNEDANIKSYLYTSPNADKNAYIDTNNLIIDKSKWLIIDGNAYFENNGSMTDSDESEPSMNVSANILVTGDVTIKGKIAFDSTMYVLGKTTINNVDLTGYNNGELILMSQKTLDIARINKFQNPDSTKLDDVNSIKAYLYTNENASVYAVGSYVYIDGGIFSNGNLEINAFRGKTEEGENDLNFTPEEDEKSSRLIVRNNKSLFINQSQGLPRINQLEVLTDLMEKDKNS